MNKLTIDGTEYELVRLDANVPLSLSTPTVAMNNQLYLGKAIPKVSEKDWQVAAYRYKSTGNIWERNALAETSEYPRVFKCVDVDNWWLHEREILDKQGSYEIYRVNRESDQTTWQVGEETEQGKIAKFWIGDHMVVNMAHGHSYKLSELTKKEMKKPILISTDNIPLYENEKCWWATETGYTEMIVSTADAYCTSKIFAKEENAKAFVQKNKPKEWTITAFKSKLTSEIRKVSSSDVKSYLEGKHWDIFSVRRNSDNEVFSLGDYMTYDDIPAKSWGDGNGCKIDKFEVVDGKMYVNSHFPQQKYKTIKDRVKVSRPILFTTHDGVKIFEGNSYWIVEDDEDFETYEADKATADSGKRTDAKYFSSREAANEYILFNKPMLSLEDLLSVWDKGFLNEHSRESNASSTLFLNFKAVAERKSNSKL